jgi:hypothetical protein
MRSVAPRFNYELDGTPCVDLDHGEHLLGHVHEEVGEAIKCAARATHRPLQRLGHHDILKGRALSGSGGQGRNQNGREHLAEAFHEGRHHGLDDQLSLLAHHPSTHPDLAVLASGVGVDRDLDGTAVLAHTGDGPGAQIRPIAPQVPIAREHQEALAHVCREVRAGWRRA